MTELASLGDANSDASTAYRQRIREHFNQLYDDTATLQAELGDLDAQAGTVTDADLIAQLLYAPCSSRHPTTSARPWPPRSRSTAPTTPTRPR
jgi:hypothetical protein